MAIENEAIAKAISDAEEHIATFKKTKHVIDLYMAGVLLNIAARHQKELDRTTT